MGELDEQTISKIAFIGDTLGPLYYYDPVDQRLEATYKAFADLDANAAASEWPFIAENAEDAKRALEMMVEGAKTANFDDIVWEHRRLFLGPTLKAAPPWGSVYTDRECVIFGNATLDLRKWMRQAGIQKIGLDGEPEDHIGLLLMMLSWIAQNKPELVDEFLEQHVLTWSSHFFDGVADVTTHPFFEGLANISRLSLEGIQKERGLSPETPKFYR